MRRRSIGRFTAWVAVVAVAVIVGRGAGAQPLADRVPGDALMYVAWGGAEKVGPGYAGSHLEAFLKESDIPKLLNESIPQFLQQLGQREPQVAQVTGMLSAIGGPLWRHPSAFYFGGYNLAAGQQKPLPKFAILCDAGNEAGQFAGLMKQLIAQAKPPYEIKVEEANGLVAIHSGIAGYSAANKPADALPGAKAFTAAMSNVGKDPVMAVYIDVEGMLKLVDQMIPPQAAQKWVPVRDAIGLGGIKRVIFTAGFDGKDWASHGFIDSPAADRKGVVAHLMSVKPLDDDFYAAIPDTANTAMAGRFDLGGLLNALKAAATQVEPQAGPGIDQGLAQVRDATGIDVQKDLLDVLGDQWAIYNDAGGAGNGIMGMVVLNKAKDAPRLEVGLTKIEDVANGLLKQNMGRNGPQIQLKRSTARNGLALHYLSIPLVCPTWAVRDGYWYAGLNPQAVTDAAEHVATKGKSIKDNAAFTALMQRLGNPKATGFVFADVPKTAPNSYGQAIMVSRLAQGFADMFGADTPPLVLPPLRKVMPHLSPAGAVSWIDDAGWHTRGIEPFPGSTAVAAGSGGPAVVAAPALAASVLLPSLNKARERANQVKCASNLRQIGMGMVLYANDHKGQFPPDLGTMAVETDMAAEVFVCPSGNTAAPPRPANPAQAEQWRKDMAAWINANGDYVYLGAGKKNTTGADVVVALEKPNAHDGRGMNLLFGDGHVEWMFTGQAMQEIEKSKNPNAKAGGL